MSSSQSVVDYILAQIETAGVVSSRKMFGEYALYCNGKVVALVCDDQFFVKPTKGGLDYIGEPEMGEPYPGAKSYFLISEDYWADAEWLTELINITVKEVPLPKKKHE